MDLPDPANVGASVVPRGIVRLLCPARNPVVRALSVYASGDSTVKVFDLSLYCGQAAATRRADVVAALAAGTPSALFEGADHPDRNRRAGLQVCSDGQIAVRVHGWHGIWVDAVGLIHDAPRLSRALGPTPVDAQARIRLPESSNPSMTVCEAARAARARNSPAAAGIEEHCRAQTPVVAAQARVKVLDDSRPLTSRSLSLSFREEMSRRVPPVGASPFMNGAFA